MTSWLDEELSGCVFKDKRLESRFKQIVKTLSKGNGKAIPDVCEQWSMAKATYRFLSNDRVEEREILAGHFNQTSNRIKASKGPVLILHDTTEFSYKRKTPDDIGYTHKMPHINKSARDRLGVEYKVCGILMHASLAISPEGLPLGLTSTKFWTRKEFKNTEQMKRKINPTRIPVADKESIKWIENLHASNDVSGTNPSRLIHIGDRESDIYEYISDCHESGAHYIVRACVNRLASESTIAEELARDQQHSYKHKIRFTNADGNIVTAALGIKVKTVILHPPFGKQRDYPDLKVTIVSALETGCPEGRPRIKWTFLTNLPVQTRTDTLSVLDWYKQRWKIEIYFKILKSGFKAEESKLRTANRLSRLISIYCILAWRIQWITMLNRESTKLSPQLAFDDMERRILEQYFKIQKTPKTLQQYITYLAQLGGYLNRANDPPPGNTVIWRGLNKLSELRTGFELALIVGN